MKNLKWITEDITDETSSEKTIDPKEAKLINLLEIAETIPHKILILHGETPSGDLQWGSLVVYGDSSKHIMEKIQEVVNNYLLEQLEQEAKNDQTIIEGLPCNDESN